MDLEEKTRLEMLLGMLSSSFDGERANAARMIAAMAEKKKLTIVELIYGATGHAQHHQQHHGRQQHKERQQHRPNPDARVMPDDIIRALQEIGEHPEKYEFVLTQWEYHFAQDVGARYERDYELSEKQLVIAEKIIAKARRGAEPA